VRELINLRKYIDEWRKTVELIPASEGAQEELLFPSAEEREDQMYTDQQIYDTICERPTGGPWWKENLYRKVRSKPRNELHLFRYFIDGSLRSYYLGEVVEAERFSPLVFAQVGACVVQRDGNGRVSAFEKRIKNLLVLDFETFSEEALSFLKRLLSGVNPELEVVNLSERDILTKSYVYERRYMATGKVKYKMRELEVELMKTVAPHLNESTWLVVDGSLMFEPIHKYLSEFYGRGVPPVIGISKNFRKDPQFVLKEGVFRKRRFNIQQLLSKLDVSERTPVFTALNGKIAFWYLRIWPKRYLGHPLTGIVKCELVLPGRGEVSSELIDILSGVIIAERNVTTYGQDSRWPAHLYPIYTAEQVIKNAFFSREVVQEILRWR